MQTQNSSGIDSNSPNPLEPLIYLSDFGVVDLGGMEGMKESFIDRAVSPNCVMDELSSIAHIETITSISFIWTPDTSLNSHKRWC